MHKVTDDINRCTIKVELWILVVLTAVLAVMSVATYIFIGGN